MKNIFLSVVIPCFNEEGNIKMGKVASVLRYLNSKKFGWEVIIVDDGSTDSSRELIQNIMKKEKKLKLIKNDHAGKANTVITGILAGSGKYLMFTDLDQATPIAQLEKFYPLFAKNIDIVIGTRKDSRAGAPLVRAIMGPGFTLLRKLILGLSHISDTQCGFKAFKREVARKIFTKLKLYQDKHITQESQVTAGFDVEVLFIALKMGYQIREIPVSWNYVETRRVSPLKDSLHAFIDLIRIRINSIKGVYS